MKKIIKIENLNDIKQVKQLSTILLGLPEVDSLEADLDNNNIILFLSESLADTIIKYYIKTLNFNVLEIREEN